MKRFFTQSHLPMMANTTLTGVSITDVVNDLDGTAFTSQSVAVTYQGSSLDGLAPPANSF